MKQKLFTLLTLLVLCVTGAWATETSVIFSSSNNNDAGNPFGDVSKNSSITAGNGLLKIFSSNNDNWTNVSGKNNKQGYRFDRNTFVFYFSGEADLTIRFSQNNTNNGYLVLKPFSSTKTLDELATSDIANLGNAVPFASVTPCDGTWADAPSSVTVASDNLSWTIVKGGLLVKWEGLQPGYYQLSLSASSEKYMQGFTADVAASTSYDITWANGGHGTAPTTPTSASTFTLPTMEADGDYVNAGWIANQTVKVGGNDVAAGTEIAAGTSVTLTVATTFTGVWKTASSFTLTSDSEVEVAIDGTSMITTSGNAGDVDYESGDLSIATVDGSGEIKAVGAGKTTITVKDPGNASTLGKSYTVTVLVPYPNPTAADSYTFTIDQYSFSNKDNTKYYFKNGFTMNVNSSAACQYAAIDNNTGIKYSHARQYTINVPSNVTVTYAVIKARNNYKNENSNAAANWGTVFGTNYSSEGNLPWSNEDPVEKDFVIASPTAGGTLVFQPGGNQWQAIITLNTIAYHEKFAVIYEAGEGTGTMAGTEVREGSTFALPGSTFTAPADKGFAGWLCSVDNLVYEAGANYTMTGAPTTFTAQYAGVEGKMIIKAAPQSTSAATVTGAIGGTADVNLQNGGDDGWKFGGDTHHIGITLASGWTFKTGDVINVHITKEQDTGGEIIFYNSDKSVIYDTNDAGVLGDNKYVLTDAFEGKTAIYLYRLNETNKWNAYIDYIEVTRPNATITLNASGYATYSAASDFTVAGAKAYKATLNTTNNKITCTEVEAVPAGAGVLLFGDANAKVAIVNTTSAAALADNDLKGTTQADGTLAAFDNTKFYYALSGDTFKHYTGAAFVAGKAYFESDTELNSKAFTIVFDGETTAINGVEEVAPVTKTRKVIKNGRLVIETANGEYTVSGARIK